MNAEPPIRMVARYRSSNDWMSGHHHWIRPKQVQSADEWIRLDRAPVRKIVGDGLLGRSVAGVGDFDGDGAPDFAVGAPKSHDLPGEAGPGFVYIYSSTGLL